MSPEASANQVLSDEHSSAKYRVIGTLSNIPEFHTAFGVKEGDKMWRLDSLIVKFWQKIDKFCSKEACPFPKIVYFSFLSF